jgi:hypothetical protein
MTMRMAERGLQPVHPAAMSCARLCDLMCGGLRCRLHWTDIRRDRQLRKEQAEGGE